MERLQDKPTFPKFRMGQDKLSQLTPQSGLRNAPTTEIEDIYIKRARTHPHGLTPASLPLQAFEQTEKRTRCDRTLRHNDDVQIVGLATGTHCFGGKEVGSQNNAQPCCEQFAARTLE
jgi:hypothetical protein